MISRREVVTAGVLGTLASASAPRRAAEVQGWRRRPGAIERGLQAMLEDKLGESGPRSVDQGLRGNSMNFGDVGAGEVAS